MYRDAAPPPEEEPQGPTRPLRRVRRGFLVAVALLLLVPALLVAKAWLVSLFITLAVGAIIGLLLLPQLLVRRVVAVHANGVTVRLPRAKRFVPWRDILAIEQTVGGRGTISFTVDARDVGAVAFPVMFTLHGPQLLRDVCAAADLHWVGAGPARRAIRKQPARIADDAGASDGARERLEDRSDDEPSPLVARDRR